MTQETVTEGVAEATELQERYGSEDLARKWERFARARLGRRVQVFDARTRRIKSRYERTFLKLLRFCSAELISPPDVYFTLLGEAFRTSGSIRFSTNLLGGKFYNSLVERGRGVRREQFSGREDRETLGYRGLSPAPPSLSADALRIEQRRFLDLRGQYVHFPRGRFWLFFVGEFSGTFLHASDDYRDSGLDLRLHLTPIQLEEWMALDGDPRLAASVKRTILAISSEEHHANRLDASPAPPHAQRARPGSR